MVRSRGLLMLQADAHVDYEKRSFYESSMQYVLVLQEVQERKKFEFVETVSVYLHSISERIHYYAI